MKQLLLLSERLEYGMQVRKQRTGKPVNYADCARAAGVSPTAVSNWKKDDSAISAHAARLLADYLGIDAAWLERGEGYPEREKNLESAKQSERALAEQITTLVTRFFELSPFGRDQLLDFAASLERPS